MSKIAKRFSASCISTILIATLHVQLEAQPAQSRHARVAELRQRLQWHGEADRNRYLAERDALTAKAFSEVDSFLVERFQSADLTSIGVKDELDTLLGADPGTRISSNVAFLASLPSGRFLIVGIEIWRGGGAINEDAISFRAYRVQGRRLTFVASSQELRSSDPDNPYLIDLRAKAIERPPVQSEFWFIGFAKVPPQSPPTIAVRLFAFDGQRFRTVWTPMDLLVPSLDAAVVMTSSGFQVDQLFDPTGKAGHSPTEVIHLQFAVTLDGPQKVAEWRNPRR
jgi:hypothetical protein